MGSGYVQDTEGLVKPVNRPVVGVIDAERFLPLNHGRVVVPDEERRKGLTVFASFPISYQTECPDCGGMLQEDERSRIECQGCEARWQQHGGRYDRVCDDLSPEELRRQRWGLD